MVLVYLALLGLSALFFAPFVWLVMTSLKPEEQIFTTVWPRQVTLANYREGLTHFPFGLYLRNTLILCTLNVLGTVLSSSLVAYGLARIPWKGRALLFSLLLSTMMLPAQVTMVPLFAVFKTLGWIDTYLPLTVPAFLGNAFFVFLLRQFFLTIPNDLTDAARLDGCTEFDIYRRVIMPLATPALATVALFTFLGTWNEFLSPLIYLFNEDKFPLSLGLAMFSSQYGSFWGQLMAVSTVMTTPIIVLFFFTQRTFIQGITMTGIKG
jgi:multiple sugar transport system permease protein